ncbi:MAG: flagellar biosynthesis protein FlhA [Acidobacteria bacterium]|nr:flagellar biosynthesis protein FlhA [Acidobacteriota bacterium]
MANDSTSSSALASTRTLLRNAEWSDMGVPLAVLAIVIALVTPLPSALLDFLLVLDIMTSVIVLMVAMYIRKAVEFSIFPSALLLLTLSRLALNISASRLILLNGNSGASAAGHVIEAFGTFVVGGNYVIGTVIFLVLIAIQYVVINHGAVRISEVTARFTLDALPGKQMSIDADMNAGLITEQEARVRRKQLSAEAEFYGAMDGASRFTQRDAVASILITGINIVAGFLIGVLQHGMDLKRALETYTILTIGEGLVSVIPALMISISGGLIVTRSSSEQRLGAEVQQQLFSNAQPLLLSSGVLAVLGMFPGLPSLPFFAASAGIGYAGWRIRQKADASAAMVAPVKKEAAQVNVESLLKVEPLALDVGLGLVQLVEGGNESPLLLRITALRRQLAGQSGYLLPPLKVSDNLSLRSREYRVMLRGAEISRYELLAGHSLAIPGVNAQPLREGKPTRDPAFGQTAFWIAAGLADHARASGYTVVDAVSIIGAHLAELIRKYACELFSRQDAKNYCDRVAQEHPKVVEDLVPKLLSLSVIQKVLQNLLRERVPVRDSVLILEAMSEAAVTTKNPILLTEFVRQAIRRVLVEPYLNHDRALEVFLLAPETEHLIEKAIEHHETTSSLALAPTRIREVVEEVRRRVGTGDSSAVLLTSTSVRYFVRQILEQYMPGVAVLSHGEIPAEVRIHVSGHPGATAQLEAKAGA